MVYNIASYVYGSEKEKIFETVGRNGCSTGFRVNRTNSRTSANAKTLLFVYYNGGGVQFIRAVCH